MTKEFTKCPNCKSPNIQAGTFEPEYGGGWRIATCDVCKFKWIEVFELVSNRDKTDEHEIDENGEVI